MSEAIDKPAEADPTVYRLRANAFVNPRLYKLTDNALTWEEEGKKLDGVFYDDIGEIRLAYAPTRLATNRYQAQVIFREGGMAELFNTDYRGFADLAEQNEAYVAFIRELHRRVAAASKTTVFRRGNSSLGYVMNILLCVFIAAGLAFVLYMLPVFDVGWLVTVKLAIILFFLPVLYRYMQRAKPGSYDPLALPDDVLPALAQGGS
jgi:hypothetical protein